MLSISRQALQRLPLYLNYLKSLPPGTVNISATTIAQALGQGDVQVRKDLAAVSDRGRPKVGHDTHGLIRDIEEFLGYDNVDPPSSWGAGNLGRALLCYDGFSTYGLDIVAAFDGYTRQGVLENGKQIFPRLTAWELCERMKVKIGIITVPAAAAQKVCDTMIEAGVLAVWNFSPVRLTVPAGVLVQDENMVVSLACCPSTWRKNSVRVRRMRYDGLYRT